MNTTGSGFFRSLFRRPLAAIAVVTTLVAGMLTIQLAVESPPQARAASSVGGSISRTEVIARAKYWYDRGDTWYSQDQSDAISDGTGGKYRPDCSGLIAMAWHLPKKSDGWDLNTDDFHSYSGKAWLSSLHDLQPGDAMLRDGHVELFEKWVDAGDHTRGSWVYSENDYGQKTNHNTDSWSEMNTYRGIRYDKIVNRTSGPDGADFNSDGVGDIFSAATGTLTIWNGKGSNNFAAADLIGGGWGPYSRPIAGDFDGDGISDLAAVADGKLHIWNGKGSNNFAAAIVTGPGWTPYAATLLSLGDVNKDGRDDIGAVSEGTFYVWNGKGDNKFGAADAIGPGWSIYSRPIGGDFDGDGIGDIAAVNAGELHIWNGKGSNNFAADVVTGPGWAPYAATLMTIGDIDSDGRTDIGAISDDMLYTWSGRGDNKFAAADVHGPGWAPYF